MDIIFIFLSLLYYNKLLSQTTQMLSYTTRDGLPSNSVYKTVLDNQGYLWIATENGLAKFDGRIFKIYTTAQGLPDNEITDLFMDSGHILWAIPFRRTPAYYNPSKDLFENDETDPELLKIQLGNTNHNSILEFGGVAYTNNERNLFFYKNGKVTGYKDIAGAKRSVTTDRIIEYKPEKYIMVSSDSIRYFSNGHISRTLPFINVTFSSEYIGHSLFITSGKQMSKYRIGAEGEIELIRSKEFPFLIRIFCKAGKDLVITSFNGTTYPVDTATLELKAPLLYNVPVRNVLEDNNGSSWISTIDRGLIKIQQKRISSLLAIPHMQQGFNALLVSNKIYAGNIYGEMLIYDGVYDLKRVALSKERNVDGLVRKILETSTSIYVACQTGSFLVDKKSFRILKRFEGPNNYSSKAAAVLNDSVLLLGNHSMAFKYNVLNGQNTDSTLKRVTALGVSKNKVIYVGSNEGLYRWDKDSLFYFGKKNKVFTYRVNTIRGTEDNLLWIGMGSDSLLVMKDDQIITSIPLGDIIPGNVCKVLYSNKQGEVWLGTNKGLNKIQYHRKNGLFSWNNTFFGTADGLTGEQVNDIFIHNDTVYIATDGGINYMPANLRLPVTDIRTFVTRVVVQGKDTAVLKSYSLPYDKSDISIEFSGVDLTGYYPLFESRINSGDWLRMDKSSIELRLSPGQYIIQIRAIKRDGTPSTQTETIVFEIKTPFWRDAYFWAAIGIVLFITSIFVLQKRNLQKQKQAVEKVITEKKLAELEMQALKAQINPHFVFNCLNSIKGFIYDKDFKQADKYLDRFSELLRSTLDNSTSAIISLEEEIKYLDNYLQLEKLRFEDKFDYTVRTIGEMEPKNVFVPSMLLQPYVENAIRHGIRHLQSNIGEIKISLEKEKTKLICVIEDNGVGRERAMELRNKLHAEYQSRGMQLSGRRAELYGIELEIIDNKDGPGNPSGTTIILRIPLELKP